LGKISTKQIANISRGRDFFTDVGVNPAKKIFGKMIYRIGLKALRSTIIMQGV